MLDFNSSSSHTGQLTAMVAHHEATKFPPVRGLPPTPDPLAPNAANPFVDYDDDIPF